MFKMTSQLPWKPILQVECAVSFVLIYTCPAIEFRRYCGVLSFFTGLIDIHVYITYILVCWFDIIIYLWCKVNKIKLLWWGLWNLRNWATTNQSELTVQYIKSCIDMKALDQEIQHSMKKKYHSLTLYIWHLYLQLCIIYIHAWCPKTCIICSTKSYWTKSKILPH